MIHTSSLIPLLNIAKLFNLPSDITQSIYFHIINNSVQLIIDKWHSYICIHNINLCYIVNRIPILLGHTLFGDTITYYDLHNKKFNITLSICAKYIKPSISDKDWWNNFVQNGFNGLTFVDNYLDTTVQTNLSILTHIVYLMDSYNH
jgi:hypothetical protein